MTYLAVLAQIFGSWRMIQLPTEAAYTTFAVGSMPATLKSIMFLAGMAPLGSTVRLSSQRMMSRRGSLFASRHTTVSRMTVMVMAITSGSRALLRAHSSRQHSHRRSK